MLVDNIYIYGEIKCIAAIGKGIIILKRKNRNNIRKHLGKVQV